VDSFRSQIAMLRARYDIVSLDEALTFCTGAKPRVVLTFDDGEYGLYEHLLPIVEEENLPVTIYVATKQIETGVAYWFDLVMNALQNEGETRIDLNEIGSWTVGPTRGKHRWAQIGTILEALKTASTADRDALAAEVVAQAGTPANGFTPLQPLTLKQLKE